MATKTLFPFRGRGEFPDRLHLLVAVVAFHARVVEKVFGFRGFARPEQGFVRVSEVATGEMRRRVGFVPGDVVEDFEAEGLQRESAAKNVVARARNPERAVGFEEAVTLPQPLQVEGVDLLEGRGFVPVAFIDAHHLPVLTRHAAVGEEIRRVGEDEVESLGFGAAQQFERVALIESQAAIWVVKARFGRGIVGKTGAQFGREVGKRLENLDFQAEFGMENGVGQDGSDRIRARRIGSREGVWDFKFPPQRRGGFREIFPSLR